MKTLQYIIFYSLMWLISSWEMMLGVGVAHLHWWPALPSMGFTTALIVGFLFSSMLTGGSVTTYALAKGWIKP